MDKFAAARREAAAAALDSFLDAAAAALPLEKRAGVRSVQLGVARGLPLVEAVRAAYPTADAVKLARSLADAAAKRANYPGCSDSPPKPRTVTRDEFHGSPAGAAEFMK